MALFVTKHNIVGDAIQQLLKIFSFVLPSENIVSTSLYSFKSYFTSLKNPLKKHYYCPKCLNEVKDKSENHCKSVFCLKSFHDVNLPYFLEIPIEDQLKSLFSQQGFFSSLQGRFNRNRKSCKDIYDGNIYNQLFENNGPLSEAENLSFVSNTDGAPVFKSSSISIWPLFLSINELDIRRRMMPENMILAGLWFSTVKPAMCTFLKPFITSMKQMYSGIKCFSPERGLFTCKAFLLAATADLPAKALLCNSVQYNGSFGCWHCVQKGETAPRGKGHVHVFPYISDEPKGPVRSMKSVLQDAQSVIDCGKVNHSINGVKGPSWLSFSPKFEMVNGMAIDYMHGVLLGVQKLLLRLWFSKEFSSESYSFFPKLTLVDFRLTRIQPTLDISRLPRSIQDELKHWKASEFQNFLLYYGLPILSDILDTERFLHYSLFVNAIFILLQSNMEKHDIDRAEMMLRNFCRKFSELYSACFMTLNVHQLIHLCDHVRNLGPLYTHSCFPFENKNGLLLKMIKGTQNIDQQIATGVSFLQKLPELKQKFVQKNSDLDGLCYLIENPHVLKRSKQIRKNSYVLGGTTVRRLSDEVFQCLSMFFGIAPTQDTFDTFIRLEINGNIVYGKEYCRMLKRDNSFIEYSDQMSVKIGQVCFFLILDSNEAFAVIDGYQCIESGIQAGHIIKVVKTNAAGVVPIEKIVGLCLAANIPDKGLYICKFPNKLDLSV